MILARFGGLMAAGLLVGTVGVHAQQTTSTIAALNNGDMIVIRKLSAQGERDKTAAPLPDFVLNAIRSADPAQPTVNPAAYTGVRFAAIPESQRVGTATRELASALAGQTTGDKALGEAQGEAETIMKHAGDIK